MRSAFEMNAQGIVVTFALEMCKRDVFHTIFKIRVPTGRDAVGQAKFVENLFQIAA